MLPELGVIFDAGTGLFRARNLIQTDTLDIFLSHVHLDHSIGLTFLYDILYEKEMGRVTVHVAEDKIDAIRSHLYNRLLFPVEPNFEIEPFQGDNYQIGESTTVDVFPLEHHPGGSHGFRLNNDGKHIAYITDTVAGDDACYLEAVRGVDALIHECYFPDGWEDKAKLTGHSCLTPVAKVAKAAEAKSLYLVHINPLDESESPLDIESVKPIFENVVVAEDQLVIEL